MKKYSEIIGDIRLWDLVSIGIMQGGKVRLPDCGTCSVIWSDNEMGWEHVSISPKKKFNIPSWNDMCIVKDIFFEDEEEVYQIHPKKSEYVNISENCLHLWKPIGIDLQEIVNERIGKITNNPELLKEGENDG